MSQDQSDKPLQWKNQWHPEKKEFVDVIELSAYQALSERLDREVEESTEYHKMWHSTLAELRAEKEIGRHSWNRAVEAEEKLEREREIVRVMESALERALDVVDFCYMNKPDNKHSAEISEALARVAEMRKGEK